jgi:transposase
MMSERGEKTYRPWEPERYRQDAQSPAAKLPEGDWVFFLLDTVPQLDLRRFYAPYEHDTRGAPPYDPAMMVCLWLYAYGVGVFSSRKIALACARTLAFLAIVGQDRPAFRTLSDFRTLHLEACKDVFGQVVRLAAEAGLVQVGNVATDGTTIQGHASRHQAMSDGYMPKAVERLREAIEAWVTQAYQQDAADDAAWGSRRGDALPAELARREDRLARIEAAMRRVGSPGQSSSGGRASAPSRRGGGAPTDGEATSRQGPDTRGGQPQRQGPEPLDGSRAA